MKRLLILTAAVVFACGCNRCDLPFGSGGVINIADAQYSRLANVGGTATVNRGYRGIIVRCESIGSYAAFEMACPNDHDELMVPDDYDAALTLTCPKCKACFDIIYGNPISGCECPLYRYSTSFDGQLISIW